MCKNGPIDLLKHIQNRLHVLCEGEKLSLTVPTGWCKQNLQGVLSKLLHIYFPVSAEKLVSQPEEFWSKRVTLSRRLLLTTYPPWKVHKEKTLKMCLCSHFNVKMPSSSDKAAAITASTPISVYLSPLITAHGSFFLLTLVQWFFSEAWSGHLTFAYLPPRHTKRTLTGYKLKIAFYWQPARWMS